MEYENNIADVTRYYSMPESKGGYQLFLGGTKHFGLYGLGDSAWKWTAALRRMEDKLAHELALPAGSLVLDAGCGVGDVADHLASMYGLRVWGIDILSFDIRDANRRAIRRGVQDLVSFQRMSYDNLQFSDGMFDGCYTMEALVHAADAETVLQQFYRVLRPGGRLVMFEYSRMPERDIPAEAAAVLCRVNQVAAMPSYQRFEHEVLERTLEQVGFRSVSVQDITVGILPMLRCFAMIGKFPYQLAKAIGREEKVINAMSAVECWRYRRYFRYNVYKAVKRV